MDREAHEQVGMPSLEPVALGLEAMEGARRVAEMPRFVIPEAATLVGQAPQDDGWLHEVKFDGVRMLARIENGTVAMYSRNDKDWTQRYGVLAEELAALPVESAMLDGEAVVQLPDGTTSFQALQELVGLRRGVGAVRRTTDPAAGPMREKGGGRLLYYVFDLLYLNGYELLRAPLEERRRLLKLVLGGGRKDRRVVFSDHIAGDGPSILEQACALGLEGVISKRTATPYRPGVRGSEWVKSKCRHEQEFVIGGYTDPTGTRVGFGALLLGVPSEQGLRYVGKVGTGFDQESLRRLGARLRSLETDGPPFAHSLPKSQRGFHWVRPELVAEVAFLEWTRDGSLRHPSFVGLREDRSPTDVTLEMPALPSRSHRPEMTADTGAEPSAVDAGSAAGRHSRG